MGFSFLLLLFWGTGCNLAPAVAWPSWDLRFVPFHLPLTGHQFFEASGKRKGFFFGVFLFSFSFPVLWVAFAGFPFRAMFLGFLALPWRPCVCVSTSVPKRKLKQTAGGQEPMTVCPGQRRPDSIGVKTYLLKFELLHKLSNSLCLVPDRSCG